MQHRWGIKLIKREMRCLPILKQCHPREGGGPVKKFRASDYTMNNICSKRYKNWIPAFAGMTSTRMSADWLHFVWLFLVICLFSYTSHAEILRGVHVVATGNNQYESKIRAHDDGMTQALSLVADEWGIKNAFFDHVPYAALKAVFSVDSIIEEASYEEKYTADVNYHYTNIGVHELMLKYGTDEVKKQFFDYVLIPVFKQKNVISFLDTKTEWLATWIDNSDECTKHKLLPIDPMKSSSKISADKIFKMSYIDLLDDLKIKRFKNILLATCEYFTRDDGSMYFKVTTESMTPDDKNVTETKYDIADPSNAKDYFDAAIERIINTYGDKGKTDMHYKNASDITYASEKITTIDDGKKAGSVLDALLVQPKTGLKLTKVEMRLDVFSAEELAHIKIKLNAVKVVAKYQIDLGDDKHYKIALYVNGSMEELAESFYNNELSYRLYDGQYVMFELASGI